MVDPVDLGYGIGVLNRKPLLIQIIWLNDTPFPFIEALSRELGETPALVFVINYWSILSRWKIDPTFQCHLNDYRSHRRRYPHHHIVLMANDITEQSFFRAHGVDSVLFQQSGFMHPYEVCSRNLDKEFDAIYIARIERYKRLELAKNIRSCCVVFGTADRAYYDEIKSVMSHVIFANGDPLLSVSLGEILAGERALSGSQTPILSRTQLSEWCARSRTGLCLSAEEGASYACSEYMLWGLPVVSTRSIGGRDDYFDERYCLVCDDDPVSVAEAVNQAISLNIDPGLIRNTFLTKVMTNRADLLRFIIRQTAEWGGSLESFIQEWLNVNTPFLDRLHSFSASQLLRELELPAGEYEKPNISLAERNWLGPSPKEYG